jgi:integrase
MKYNDSTPTPLTKSQLKRLIENSPNTLGRILIATAIATGMRRAEVVSLELKHINLQERTMLHPKTKGGKRRLYTLPENYVKVLKKWVNIIREYYPDSVWLFPNGWKPEEHIKPHRFNALFSEARIKSKLDIFNPYTKAKGRYKYNIHSLRDTFCCLLLQNGTDIYNVKELMGHSKLDTTLRYYAYLPNKNKTEIINRTFNSDTDSEKDKGDLIAENEYEVNSLDPIKELQFRLINDDITEEEYKRKLNLIGGLVLDDKKNSYIA